MYRRRGKVFTPVSKYCVLGRGQTLVLAVAKSTVMQVRTLFIPDYVTTRQFLCSFLSQECTTCWRTRKRRQNINCMSSVGDQKCLQNFSRKTWREETTSYARRRSEDDIKMESKETFRTGFHGNTPHSLQGICKLLAVVKKEAVPMKYLR
jgi:hypothetical protein